MNRFGLPLALMLAASTALADDPVNLRIMTYNIWYGGAQVSFEQTIATIRAADADIVGLQEPDGQTEAIAKAAGFENAITCDLGGTSFDVSLVAGGEMALAAQATMPATKTSATITCVTGLDSTRATAPRHNPVRIFISKLSCSGFPQVPTRAGDALFAAAHP